MDAFRPVFAIAVPISLAFFRLSRQPARLWLATREWRICITLILILLVNHLLGKGLYLTSVDANPYSNLGIFALAGMLLFFSFGSASGRCKNLDGTVRAACLVFAVVQAGAVLFLSNSIEHQGTMRHVGFQSDPNIVILYILPSYMYSLGGHSYKWLRWAIYATLPVIIAALLATLSKMAALLIPVLVLTALACVAARKARRHILGVLVGCGLLFACVLGGSVFGDGFTLPDPLPLPAFVGDKISDLSHRVSASAHKDNVLDEKLFWWDVLAETNWLSIDPLLGPGWSYPQNPHNTFLDMYFMGGIPAGLLSVVLFLYPVLRLVRHPSNVGPGISESHFIASVASMVALLLILCALSMPTNKLVWLLLGLNCGYAHRYIQGSRTIEQGLGPSQNGATCRLITLHPRADHSC